MREQQIMKRTLYNCADLHIHTNFSDGVNSPEEVIKYAQNTGISAIAITDHDTVEGLPKAIEVAEKADLEMISGAEFSVCYTPVMHILGYFLDITRAPLIELFDELKRRKNRLITKAFRGVKRAGISISPLDVLNKEKSITIVKLRKYLIEAGYINFNDAVDLSLKLLLEDWKNNLPTPQKCISIIHKSGGLAFLAHPKLLYKSDEELQTILKQLKEYGLDGIEVIHPMHSIEDIEKYMKWGEEMNLLYSGGSDYHGYTDHYKNERMKMNDIDIPYSYVIEMKRTIGKKNED